MTIALIELIIGMKEIDCKNEFMINLHESMGPAGIELATHNYFIQVTLRFQIRATHAY